MNKNLNLKAAFSFAFSQLKNKFLFLIISFNVIPFFLSLALWAIIGSLTHFQNQKIYYNISGVVSLSIVVLLGVYVMYALCAAYISLRLVDNNPVMIMDIVSQYPLILHGLLLYLIYWTLVSVGLFFFAIPGLYLATRWFFFPYALVEGHSIRESLGYSAQLSQGIKLQLLVYLLIIAALIAIPIANFFAPIISSLASAWLYRDIERQYRVGSIAHIA